MKWSQSAHQCRFRCRFHIHPGPCKRCKAHPEFPQFQAQSIGRPCSSKQVSNVIVIVDISACKSNSVDCLLSKASLSNGPQMHPQLHLYMPAHAEELLIVNCFDASACDTAQEGPSAAAGLPTASGVAAKSGNKVTLRRPFDMLMLPASVPLSIQTPPMILQQLQYFCHDWRPVLSRYDAWSPRGIWVYASGWHD